LTWGDFQDCLEGFNERLKLNRRLEDALNHALGRYVGIAVNDPKKYPKEPFYANDERKANVANTDEERARIARLKYKRI